MSNSWSRVPANVRRRLRAEVFERDGGICQVQLPGCTGVAEVVDHTIPRAKGGPLLDTANLRAACSHCNYQRNRKQFTPRGSRTW